MELIIKIIVCFFAGAGAGIGTGFAGMSAAAVIGPFLVTFLDMAPYQAIGIGLLSDVVASAVSAYNYKKAGNLDIKNSLPLMVSVLVMTVAGSYVATFMPDSAMSGTMQIAMILLGIKFIIKPVMTTKEQMANTSAKKRLIQSVAGGSVIGFICGFVGAGGGMMMLMVLTMFLGYALHMAVGTSVFIMAFTALTGGISHIVIGGMPDITVTLLCVIFTLLWAFIASKIANNAKTSTLNRVVGVVLILSSIVILTVNDLLK